MNLKLMVDLNIKAKTKTEHGENLNDFGLGKDFLNRTQKPQRGKNL